MAWSSSIVILGLLVQPVNDDSDFCREPDCEWTRLKNVFRAIGPALIAAICKTCFFWPTPEERSSGILDSALEMVRQGCFDLITLIASKCYVNDLRCVNQPANACFPNYILTELLSLGALHSEQMERFVSDAVPLIFALRFTLISTVTPPQYPTCPPSCYHPKIRPHRALRSMLLSFDHTHDRITWDTNGSQNLSQFTNLSYDELIKPAMFKSNGSPEDIDRQFDELCQIISMVVVDRSRELCEAMSRMHVFRWSVSVIQAHQKRVGYAKFKRGGSYAPYSWKDYHLGYMSCISFWIAMLDAEDLGIINGVRIAAVESGLLFVLERFSIFAEPDHLGKEQYLRIVSLE